MKIGKYMTAKGVGMAPREVYTIHGRAGDALGTVEWYKPWKKYVFDPEIGAVFSSECLRDLADFLLTCCTKP